MAYIHTSIHPCIHTYIHTSKHPYTNSSIHPFIHPSIRPPIHPSTHSPIQPSIHPSIHSSIHPFIHPSILDSRFHSFEMAGGPVRSPARLCTRIKPASPSARRGLWREAGHGPGAKCHVFERDRSGVAMQIEHTARGVCEENRLAARAVCCNAARAAPPPQATLASAVHRAGLQ